MISLIIRRTRRGVHCIITAAVWLAVIIECWHIQERNMVPVRIGGRTEKIAARDWAATLALCGMQDIDVPGLAYMEGDRRSQRERMCSVLFPVSFIICWKWGLVLLIIVYGQKASEMLLGRESE